MMAYCFVFNTPADAATAMQQLNASRGFSDRRTETSTWATIETRATDGKSIFIAPPAEWLFEPTDQSEKMRPVITVPYTIEAATPEWFPAAPEPMPKQAK
jgi:hypothetical protein